MRKRILKAISVMLIMCLSAVTTSSQVLASQEISNANNSINRIISSKDGILYEEKFEDSQKNNIHVTIEKTGKTLEVKTYVNDIQLDSAKRTILPNGSLDDTIQYVKYSQNGNNLQTNQVKTFNAKELLEKSKANSEMGTNKEALVDSTYVIQSASYPYIKSEYSSAWGYWGDLYGKNTDTSTVGVPIYFDPYTSISVIVSFLIGVGIMFYTGFTITGLLLDLGAAFASGFITSLLTGTVYQTTRHWDYEVYVQQTLSLVAWIDYITTVTYNSGGYQTGEYYDIESSGPYDNESEAIQYGIYIYAVILS